MGREQISGRDSLKNLGLSMFGIQARRYTQDCELPLGGMKGETHTAVQAEITRFAHEVANRFVITLQRRDLLPGERRHVADTMGYHRVNRHVCFSEIACAPFVLVTADEDVIGFNKRGGKTRDILETIKAVLIAKRGTRRVDFLYGTCF